MTQEGRQHPAGHVAPAAQRTRHPPGGDSAHRLRGEILLPVTQERRVNGPPTTHGWHQWQTRGPQHDSGDCGTCGLIRYRNADGDQEFHYPYDGRRWLWNGARGLFARLNPFPTVMDRIFTFSSRPDEGDGEE